MSGRFIGHSSVGVAWCMVQYMSGNHLYIITSIVTDNSTAALL